MCLPKSSISLTFLNLALVFLIVHKLHPHAGNITLDGKQRTHTIIIRRDLLKHISM